MKNLKTEAVIVAAGLVLLGAFLYMGLDSFAARDRVVSVRGLAEREVEADHVIWPIVYKTTGNNLQDIYSRVNDASARIADFLKKNGVPAADISVSAPQIIDLEADRYNTQQNRDRYNVTSITTVKNIR